MEPTRSFSRHRRPSSDRFLSIFSQSPLSEAAISAGDELSEDDILWNGEPLDSPSQVSSSSLSASSTPPAQNHLYAGRALGRADSFGILAALPGIEQERSGNRSISNHRAASAASARTIPVIPRPPPERSLSASLKFLQLQSAPVNVPMMRRKDFERGRKGSVLEDTDDLEPDEEEGEMLPPHEIVARQSVKSPIVSCSVLEGAGRTLKGRDLRQVRNAVFRQTGFLD